MLCGSTNCGAVLHVPTHAEFLSDKDFVPEQPDNNIAMSNPTNKNNVFFNLILIFFSFYNEEWKTSLSGIFTI
jgi:hypothetical protein